MPFDAEWIWVEAWSGCHTARGGENAGSYFTRIFTVTRRPNTNLSKDKRFKHFYADSLSLPTTFFTTFDSKHRVKSLDVAGCY